jgi:hypothetical protein
MARKRATSQGEEIEIDYSGDAVYLTCEPAAFAAFRNAVQSELTGLPLDEFKTIEINEVDDLERHATRSYSVGRISFVLGIVIMVAIPWIAGVVRLGQLLVRWISN